MLRLALFLSLVALSGCSSNPTSAGSICAEGTQTCVAGGTAGPPFHERRENHANGCDGSPEGAAVTGYLQPTTPKGVPCAPATKTCLNGSWVGPQVFATCTEI